MGADPDLDVSRAEHAAPASGGEGAETAALAANATRGMHFIWSITLREALLLVVVADLVALSKILIKLPLHVPGHSGIVWIALMVVAVGVVGKFGAGTLVGLIAGFIVTLFSPGKLGIFQWMNYAAAGLVLDLLCLVFASHLRRYIVAAIVGAAAHVAKLTTATLIGKLLGLPMWFLVVGLGFSAVTHVVFGAIGGMLGALILRQFTPLRRLPGLLAFAVLCLLTISLAAPPARAATFTQGGASHPFRLSTTSPGLSADSQILTIHPIVWSLTAGQIAARAAASFPGNPRSIQQLGNGNVLIADRDNHQVVELSPNGQLVWCYSPADDPAVMSPFSAQQFTRAGTTYVLIADRVARRVFAVVYAPGQADDKRLAWQYGVTGVTGTASGELSDPFYAQYVPTSDSVLISDNKGAERVIEVSWTSKSVIWQYGMAGTAGSGVDQLEKPHQVQGLPDGNTLIVDSDAQRVIEVRSADYTAAPGPSGAHGFTAQSIVWQYGVTGHAGSGPGVLNNPTGACRLPGGDTLISDTGNERVIAVNRSGQIVWQYTLPADPAEPGVSPAPRAALRLNDGTTLVCDSALNRVIDVASSATATSPSLDCGTASSKRFTTLSWNAVLPVGSSLSIDYRLDNGAWHTVAVTRPQGSTTLASGTVGQRLQYRVRLKTDNPASPPALSALTFTYTAVDTTVGAVKNSAGANGNEGTGQAKGIYNAGSIVLTSGSTWSGSNGRGTGGQSSATGGQSNASEAGIVSQDSVPKSGSLVGTVSAAPANETAASVVGPASTSSEQSAAPISGLALVAGKSINTEAANSSGGRGGSATGTEGRGSGAAGIGSILTRIGFAALALAGLWGVTIVRLDRQRKALATYDHTRRPTGFVAPLLKGL